MTYLDCTRLQQHKPMALLATLVLLGSTVQGEVSYEHDIKPLLKTKCWACHGPLKQESSLRLDTGELIRQGGDSGPAVNLSNLDESLLLQRITSQDEYERMPPEGEPLTSKQVGLLREWIRQGATSPVNEEPQQDPREHWAFQPVRALYGQPTTAPAQKSLPDIPEGVHPVDFFIQRKLSAAGLALAPQADPSTLIRRLFLDMHGLPPTWEQIQTFQGNPSSEAFETLIEEVLNSPRYGERWGQHWLDVTRYADTHGFEVNTPRPHAWPYRDYVIESLNDDKPYDQFVREQIAGDAFQADAATGFLVAAAVLLPGQIGKDEPSKRLARQDSLDEIVVGTSGTFLGLTLGCARCHDHKFDPLSQRDYFAMQAFFAGVDYGDREIRDEDYQQRKELAKKLGSEIQDLQTRLLQFEPTASVARTIVIDDEDLERVSVLKKKNGHGQNPNGGKRGYRDDPGSDQWMPNISQGRYTWWDNHPGEDVFTYNPQSAGRFQIWLSWGAHGSGVHTRDARYVLDIDGDLSTTIDQSEIGRVDQYYVAGKTTGETERQPLWSGLQDAGIHQLESGSKIILRGGDTGTGITADVIVLQEVTTDGAFPQEFPQFRPPVNFARNMELIQPQLAKRVRFTSLETTNSNRYEPCIDELEIFTSGEESENVALASNGVLVSSSGNLSETGRHQLKHINDGQYGNERSWISNERGKGWVQVEFQTPQLIERIVWGRDRQEKLKDRLPVRYLIEVGDESGNWTTVAGSADRLPFGTPFDEVSTQLRNSAHRGGAELVALSAELKQLERQRTELMQPKLVYAGKFREPDPTHLLMRGDPEQPAEPVLPQIPEVFATSTVPLETKTEQERRLALADWIASPENPLTARVIANRIWQYHFGTGIVATSSDFGLNGSQPSHPELLDWLAQELTNNGWSLKHLHRVILTSKTWQQSNRIDPTAQKLDGDCRLLWRFPARRLEAEAIRDSLLFVSDQLNLKMGGPGFDFFKTRGGLNGFPPVISFTDEGRRRMVYSHKIRMERVPIFGAFDCPDAGQPAPTRSNSTTAIQALNLFNGEFIAEQALTLAKQQSEQQSIEAQVQAIYQKILGRTPFPAELTASVPVVEAHGLSTLCRVLFNSNEFLTLP